MRQGQHDRCCGTNNPAKAAAVTTRILLHSSALLRLLLLLTFTTAVALNTVNTNSNNVPQTPPQPQTLSPCQTVRTIHLNHAGASPSPAAVTDRIVQHLATEVTLGGYAAQAAVQPDLDRVYASAARLIHAPAQFGSSGSSSNGIALVESATVGWTRLFYAMAHSILDHHGRFSTTTNSNTDTNTSGARPVILLSEAEYAANVVGACQWARHHDWHVLVLPSTTTDTEDDDDDDDDSPNTARRSTGRVDLSVLDDMLQGRYVYHIPTPTTTTEGRTRTTTTTRVTLDPANVVLVCITHVPTNSGICNPVDEIGRRLSAVRQQQQQQHRTRRTSTTSTPVSQDPPWSSSLPLPYYLVDACQSVGQLDVNVETMQCHGLVATGRKYLRGPRGTGFLYAASDILVDLLEPVPADHAAMPIDHVPPPLGKNSNLALSLSLRRQDHLSFAPRAGAKRFEFWEASVANQLGLGCAIDARLATGMTVVADAIHSRALSLYEALDDQPQPQACCSSTNEDEEAHGNDDTHHTARTSRRRLFQRIRRHHRPEAGIVTFSVDGIPSADIKDALWEETTMPVRIVDHEDSNKDDSTTTMTMTRTTTMETVRYEASVVPATSTPMDSARTNRREDLVRLSVTDTTTQADIEGVCARLEEILRAAYGAKESTTQ